jgi:c-di-GMP-related signal transduction protein
LPQAFHPSMSHDAATDQLPDTMCLARRAIFDRSDRLFGYELLYRAPDGETRDASTSDAAAARALTGAFLVLGLETLTRGLPAFMKVSRRLLLDDGARVAPPRATIFELSAGLEVDAELLETCRLLRSLGYRLAIDDYRMESRCDSLLQFVDFVKVDIVSTSRSMRSELVATLRPSGVKAIADRVDTAEAATEAREQGFDLLQGYFFCKPATLSSRTVPGRRLAYFQLLAALNRPDLSLDRLEELIKHDASLSHLVLRSINSAAFAVQRDIHSVREAIVLLGRDQIRKWASMWAMGGVTAGGSTELAVLAILRARCCELLGKTTSVDHASECFLLGLCSLLDAILDRPMAQAISDLPLSPLVRGALLGERGPLRSILDAVIAHEQGAWDDAQKLMRGTGASAETLSHAYSDALRWARELSDFTAAA